MAQNKCPNCGSSIDSNRSACPTCRKVVKKSTPTTAYLSIAAIAVVINVVGGILLVNPGGNNAGGPVTPVPTSTGTPEPTQPTCFVAITGHKVPPTSIELQVKTSSCRAGDITELRVSIDGAPAGTLSPNPGTLATIADKSGSKNVIVVAKFVSGAESVVYRGTDL